MDKKMLNDVISNMNEEKKRVTLYIMDAALNNIIDMVVADNIIDMVVADNIIDMVLADKFIDNEKNTSKTVKDVYDTMTDEEKDVLLYLTDYDYIVCKYRSNLREFDCGCCS